MPLKITTFDLRELEESSIGIRRYKDCPHAVKNEVNKALCGDNSISSSPLDFTYVMYNIINEELYAVICVSVGVVAAFYPFRCQSDADVMMSCGAGLEIRQIHFCNQLKDEYMVWLFNELQLDYMNSVHSISDEYIVAFHDAQPFVAKTRQHEYFNITGMNNVSLCFMRLLHAASKGRYFSNYFPESDSLNMEVEVKNLIDHEYDETDLSLCTTNAVKMEDFNWDDVSSYADSDIVISIRNIDTNEDFAFFFFDKKDLPNGNRLFYLKKVLLDEKLPKESIRQMTERVLTVLTNGRYNDGDYIVSKGNYRLYRSHVKDAINGIFNEIMWSDMLIKASLKDPL